jgi:NAD kinase
MFLNGNRFVLSAMPTVSPMAMTIRRGAPDPARQSMELGADTRERFTIKAEKFSQIVA